MSESFASPAELDPLLYRLAALDEAILCLQSLEGRSPIIFDDVEPIVHRNYWVGYAQGIRSVLKQAPDPFATYSFPDLVVRQTLTSEAQMSDKNAKLAKAQYESEHDDLTGLLNRRGLRKRIRAELAQNPDKVYGLASLDLGNLKAINDLHGHEEGDNTIVAVSKNLRQSDIAGIAGRYGGDEFLVLLGFTPRTTKASVPGDTETRHAATLSPEQRLELATARFHDIPNRIAAGKLALGSFGFFVSVGAVLITTDDSLKMKIREADEAMYADKVLQQQTYGKYRRLE